MMKMWQRGTMLEPNENTGVLTQLLVHFPCLLKTVHMKTTSIEQHNVEGTNSILYIGRYIPNIDAVTAKFSS